MLEKIRIYTISSPEQKTIPHLQTVQNFELCKTRSWMYVFRWYFNTNTNNQEHDKEATLFCYFFFHPISEKSLRLFFFFSPWQSKFHQLKLWESICLSVLSLKLLKVLQTDDKNVTVFSQYRLSYWSTVPNNLCIRSSDNMIIVNSVSWKVSSVWLDIKLFTIY